MKRFVALFVLLAVLGMCAPSYGYILIYKAQIYGKALSFDDSSITYGKVKAFVVLAVGTTPTDSIGELSVIPDGCDGIIAAEVIFYDRYKGPKFYLETEPEINLSLAEPEEVLEAITINAQGYQSNLVGDLKPTNIGLDGKVYVARDLVGGVLMNGGFFDQMDIIGAATVTATLDTKLTKMANTMNVDTEEEAFITTSNAIISSLEAKGFHNLD